ncbi:Conserved_hypothetical protein [Hexamita inflata]|uniref:Uncharacterized protein n=1 Tax=Hexamita inflata TaxID=28002 RepID=A0AA86R9H5_9EUKA|nr:Conserved hypothetical protein [Hexamita inflata]
MPSLIEKIAYNKPPRFKKEQLRFVPVYIDVPQLNQKIYIDIIEPPTQLKQLPFTIIYSHSNQETANIQHTWLTDVSKMLCSRIISYDYLGYGMNTGVPTESSSNMIAVAIYDYVQATYPLQSVISWGRSIGSTTATFLAQTKQIYALIIESGLSSGIQVFCKKPLCVPSTFNNALRLLSVKCRTLIVHGTEDELVPFRCAEENFNKLRKENPVKEYYNTKHQERIRETEQCVFVSVNGAGHNDIDNCYEETLIDSMIDFLGEEFKMCTYANKQVKTSGQQTQAQVGRSDMFFE